MSNNLQKTEYRTNPNYLIRKVTDQYLLVAVGSTEVMQNKLMTLNETGRFIWDNLQDFLTIEELTVRAKKQFIDKNDVLEEELKVILDLSGYALRNLKGADVVLSGEYKVESTLTKGSTDPLINYGVHVELGDIETPTIQHVYWLDNDILPTSADWSKQITLAKISNLGELISDDCHVEFIFRDVTGSISFRNIKLEIGTKATDWTPAPDS